MSTSEPEFDPEDYEGLQPRQVQLHPAELRKLRKKEKEAEELRSQLAELQRRETFRDAGIPINDRTKYFIKAYEGDLDPEAIRAEAIKAGLIESTAPSTQEIAGHTAAAAAAAGADPVNSGPNWEAKLAEMSKASFAPGDDTARANHIAELLKLAKEAPRGPDSQWVVRN